MRRWAAAAGAIVAVLVRVNGAAAEGLVSGFGAALDSLPEAGRLHEYQAFVASWHEFFLMAGTAAVTLAGLLFVAISLHLEVLVQPRFAALLVVARSTLSSFVAVLVVSLMFLVPHSTPRVTGVTLCIFTVIFNALAIREMRGPLSHNHADFSSRLLRRRLMAPLVGYALIFIVGLFVLRGTLEMMFLMISATCLLLANAVWGSWDLLVRVARAKERSKGEG